MLCDEVKKREQEKLKDAEMLRGIVDLVYFPTFPLLWRSLRRLNCKMPAPFFFFFLDYYSC